MGTPGSGSVNLSGEVHDDTSREGSSNLVPNRDKSSSSAANSRTRRGKTSSNQNNAGKKGHNCRSCDKKDTMEMVQCDACDGWHHYNCVGVDASVASVEWLCKKCDQQKQQSTLNVPQSETKQCVACNNPIGNSLIACTKCKKAYHELCIPPGSSAATNLSGWACSDCLTPSEKSRLNATITNSSQQRSSKTGSAPTITQHETVVQRPEDKRRNKSSPTHKSASTAKKELELERLEEEMQLAQKRLDEELLVETRKLVEKKRQDALILEQQFLNKKYELKEKALSDRSSSTSVSTNSGRLTKAWVESQNKLRSKANENVDNCRPTLDFAEFPPLPLPNHNVVPPINNDLSLMFHNSSIVAAPLTKENVKGQQKHNEAGTPRTHQQPLKVFEQKLRDLPKFDGNPMDWPIFYANYTSTTQRYGYTREDNVERLQKALQGQARKDVLNMLALPESVDEVMDTLKMLYGRPKVIIGNAMAEIRAQAVIKPDELQRLIKFALLVKNCSKIIEMTGLKYHLNNPDILDEILGKLPASMKLDWGHQFRRKPDSNLIDLGQWLTEYAQDACVVTSFQSTAAPRPPITATRNPHVKSAGNKPFATHNIHFDNETKPIAESAVPSSGAQCAFCRSTKHFIAKCEAFINQAKSKRWDFVLDNRLCTRCLEPHAFRRCKSRQQCGVDGCNKSHHITLHSTKSNNGRDVSNCPTPRSVPDVPQKTSSGTVTATRCPNRQILFRILPVVIHGPKASANTFAFLDEGSSVTMMEQHLAREVGVEGPANNLCLTWTNEQTRVEENSMVVNVSISGEIRSKQFELQAVRTVQSLNLPSQTMDIAETIKCYPYLNDVTMANQVEATPRLLIGLDNWNVSVPQAVREGGSGEPIAIQTRIGWTISGPSRCGSVSHGGAVHHVHICESHDDKLHQMVKNFFSLDNFGVQVPKYTLESKEDTRAKMIMEKTTIRVASHFETGLLWARDDIILPKSFEMAKKGYFAWRRR